MEEVTASEIAVYDAVERDLVNDVVDGTSVLRIPTAAVPSDITNGVQFSLAQPTFVTTAVPNVTPVEIDVTAALPYINGAEEQVTYSAVESCTADDTVPSSSLLASSSTTVMTTAVHGITHICRYVQLLFNLSLTTHTCSKVLLFKREEYYNILRFSASLLAVDGFKILTGSHSQIHK